MSVDNLVPSTVQFNGPKKFFPRVSTLTKAPSDLFALSLWSQRMVAVGLALRPDLLALAASLDPKDKDGLNRLCEDAKEAAGSNAGANVGTALHTFSEQVDRGMEANIPHPWKNRIVQYQETVRAAGLTPVPEYIERRILNTEFECAGTFDRLLRESDGTLCVADLKSGNEVEYSQKEISIQLFLYASAPWLCGWDPEPDKFGYRLPLPTQNPHLYTPMPKVRQDYGYVIHLPRDGDGCHLYKVDLEAGRYGANLSRDVRAWRKRSDLFQKVCVEPSGPSTDKWLTEIDEARTTDDLNRIYREATDRGAWNSTLLNAGQKRKDEILSGADFQI